MIFKQKDDNGVRTYTLEISHQEAENITFSGVDKLMLKSSFKENARISDRLFGLQLIAANIERANGERGEAFDSSFPA